MAFDSAATFRQAAQNAAARWKDAKNRSPALKDQIMDSFRLTKRIQEFLQTGVYSVVKQAWKAAFQQAGCAKDFDFDDTSEI